MGFLQKILSLPEPKRKIILRTTVIIIGIFLFIFYVKITQQRLKSFRNEEIKEQLRLPEFQEKLKKMPKLEIPEISEEELKKLEEELKEYGE